MSSAWLACCEAKQKGVDTSKKSVNNLASVLITDLHQTMSRLPEWWLMSGLKFFNNSQPISVGV
jgi:hypothetical protein